MADNGDYDLEEDELSDSALDAEIKRQIAESAADSARLDAEADADTGPATLGVEGLSTAELDELIQVRTGELEEPTSAKVRAALAAQAATEVPDDEEIPVAPGSVSALSDSEFAALLQRRSSGF
jgi:hypothetical protein